MDQSNTSDRDKNSASYRAIHQWVNESLRQNFAKNVRDPLSTFKYATSGDETLSFADAVKAFKKIVVRDNGFVAGIGLTQRVDHGFTRGDLKQLQAVDLSDASLNAVLKGALVEAQVGFVDVTEKEFEALKMGTCSASELPNGYGKIYTDIPHEALQNVTFEKFKQIVDDVLVERNIVTAPVEQVQPAPVIEASTAKVEASYAVTPKGQAEKPINKIGIYLNSIANALNSDPVNVEAARTALNAAMKEYDGINVGGRPRMRNK